jgi:hypothetical protein
MNTHSPKLRLGITAAAAEEQFEPSLHNAPALPVIDWSQVGQQAPALPNTPAGQLPKASAVVITWASAEWAAMEHVFCSSATAMAYSDRSKGNWPGWQKYDSNLAANAPSNWNYWGYYRLVQIAGKPVLLFKSNTHLDWPGSTYLQDLINLIAAHVHGSFVNVDVVDDAYYNTNLKAVQVDGCAPVNALPLPTKYGQTMISNSIIDSGTNSLAVSKDVLTAIMKSLASLSSQFVQLINKANQQGSIPASQLDLSKWPGISFILASDTGGEVTLTCSPQTYWQVDAPKAGEAMFQINDMGSVQSILGLPLLNNYYSVFDRSLDSYGSIRFAPIK